MHVGESASKEIQGCVKSCGTQEKGNPILQDAYHTASTEPISDIRSTDTAHTCVVAAAAKQCSALRPALLIHTRPGNFPPFFLQDKLACKHRLQQGANSAPQKKKKRTHKRCTKLSAASTQQSHTLCTGSMPHSLTEYVSHAHSTQPSCMYCMRSINLRLHVCTYAASL